MSEREHSQRARLLGVKLTALVGDHLGEPVTAEVEEIPDGAALLHGTAAWVLVDDGDRRLGAALAWAVRHDATSLDIVTQSGGGALARRAEGFSLPTSVWFAHDRSMLPTMAEPLAEPPAADAAHRALTDMIVTAGAEPNIEHGVVFGEVRGLEVCRVVDQPTTGFFTEFVDTAPSDTVVPAPGVRLEVGVGAADREAFQMLHGDIPTVEALASVVDVVSSHRSEASIQHPLNRLGRERFLRWKVGQDPSSIGLTECVPAEPPLPRPNLKDPEPCVADGVTVDGRAVRIVFSNGVDLDLIPYVVDVQSTTDRDVLVAVPERDLVPITRDLAALLRTPVEFVTL